MLYILKIYYVCVYACLSIRYILPLDIHFIFLFNFMPLSVISELSKLWFLLAKYQLVREWEVRKRAGYGGVIKSH